MAARQSNDTPFAPTWGRPRTDQRVGDCRPRSRSTRIADAASSATWLWASKETFRSVRIDEPRDLTDLSSC